MQPQPQTPKPEGKGPAIEVLAQEEAQHVRQLAMDDREREQNDRSSQQDERERLQDEREQLRDLFVGILGHDLNSPLTSIVMGAALLSKAGAIPERELRVVARMARAADRMRRMIDQLVEVTRIRLGPGMQLARQWTDVVNLVQGILDETSLACPDTLFEFISPKTAPGEFDRSLLAQMVSNLLTNAVAYGEPLAPIVVRIGTTPQEISLEVRNRGEPIPPALIPVLFDPFRRGQHPGRHTRGLGLGLFITKSFAEAHGGSLSVSSSAEAGTSFCVTLPR